MTDEVIAAPESDEVLADVAARFALLGRRLLAALKAFDPADLGLFVGEWRVLAERPVEIPAWVSDPLVRDAVEFVVKFMDALATTFVGALPALDVEHAGDEDGLRKSATAPMIRLPIQAIALQAAMKRPADEATIATLAEGALNSALKVKLHLSRFGLQLHPFQAESAGLATERFGRYLGHVWDEFGADDAAALNAARLEGLRP